MFSARNCQLSQKNNNSKQTPLHNFVVGQTENNCSNISISISRRSNL